MTEEQQQVVYIVMPEDKGQPPPPAPPPQPEDKGENILLWLRKDDNICLGQHPTIGGTKFEGN